MITITENARTFLLAACKEQGVPNIKLSVKSGGCAGFQYEYKFSDSAESGDFPVTLDEGHNFLVDGMSLIFVAGFQLDYVTELAGSHLVIKNPNQKSSCGCGKSFNV